ncbi:Tyrosine-protein phosphatase 1 [Apiospora arundinis]|uniref:protein-tyrosine-phosphatase n=1 Tax=Apiospora arundinis TaxID=335852 RepID=A0ABR2IFH0_9PEZI
MAPDSANTRDQDRSTTSTTTKTPTSHYTMKTSTRPTMSSSHSIHSHHSRHSQSNSQNFRVNRSTTTPMTSPRMPHSVGQPYPPGNKLSPAVPSDVRSPSPNYFGLNVDPNTDPRDSAVLPRENWSPPTSSVKSFGAAIPKQVPLDANPDFEAFRRQADLNRGGNSFNLGSAQFAPMQPMQPPSSLRPRAPPRRSTNQGETPFELSRPPLGRSRETTGSRMDIDSESLHDSAYVSSDSKRNSEISLNAPSFFDMPTHASPAQTESPFQPIRRSNLSKVEDAHPRLSLPPSKTGLASPGLSHPRSETLPTALSGDGPSLLMPAQLKEILESQSENDYLLLDVRVSTNYAQSRIEGALNLCIPTTLLKRATFNLEKLQKTLQTEEDQEKFSQWRGVKTLIIYDAASSEKRDALSAVNMFKKFTNESFTGNAYLLRGGFNAFANAYPDWIDRRHAAERAGRPVASNDGGRPTFAPVIGGVTLPAASNGANPFFGNIRQNMDLADGVGQMEVALPAAVDTDSLPHWLRDAAAKSDHGKSVSDKFLRIERDEQSRMKEAYSAFNASSPSKANSTVSLSGIEKGVKNRYKDILPFDHARVVLSGKPPGSCDYINASHVRASRSKKRYIASQGPLPATFEDFWSVIWDQDVRVIVMLTAESEGGQLKCHPYWNDREYGPIKLRPLSEKKVSLDIDKHRSNPANPAASQAEAGRRRANTATALGAPPPPAQAQAETPYVVIRKFAMSHSTHPFAPMREVTHLHYPSWPDFGVPAQPSHLLALVELANVMQRAALPVDANAIAASVATERGVTPNWYDEPESDSESRPMLVHCSAGCGRTGTFCTVDSVIDMLKRERIASVAANKRRDNDGDISMDGASRSSSRAPTGRGNSGPHGNDANIDLSWVGDDSIDLIARTVEDFRSQRLSMVQSLRQFVLCYETIVEWIWRLQERSSQTANGKRGHIRSESEAPFRR